MRDDQSMTFALAKSILAACDTEEDLQNAVRFLRSETQRRSLVEALQSFLDDQRGIPRVEQAPREHLDSRKENESRIETVMSLLKDRRMTPTRLHHLMVDQFGVDEPVNKMGLRRYVERLSRKPVFKELYAYLMSQSDAEEDPWMKEMLLHRRNAYAHEK